MTTAEVAEMSVTVNNNSPIQDYVDLDDHAQPTYEMTPCSNLSQKYQYIIFFFCLSFYFYCKNRSLLSNPKGTAV